METRFTRKLRCELSEADMASAQHNACELERLSTAAEIDQLAAKAEAKHWRDKLEVLLLDLRHELVLLRQGWEERPVECETRLNHQTGRVDLVRLDTGEIFETRNPTPEERQGGFSWPEGADA